MCVCAAIWSRREPNAPISIFHCLYVCVCLCVRESVYVCVFLRPFHFWHSCSSPRCPSPTCSELFVAWGRGAAPRRISTYLCIGMRQLAQLSVRVCLCVYAWLSVPLCVCGLFTSTSRAVRKILKRDAILLELRANVQLALAVRRVARCELPQQPRTVRKAESTWRAH